MSPIGAALFERSSQGLKLTAAGEVLVEAVRRWRRDFQRVTDHIEDLKGLRRGEVSVVLVEGAAQFLVQALRSFRSLYPDIAFRIQTASAQTAADLVIEGVCDIGLTYNPPNTHLFRVERTSSMNSAVLAPRGHPLTSRPTVSLVDCADFKLVLPDERLSLRDVIDKAWMRAVGEQPRYFVEANSKELIKLLVAADMGVALAPAIDAGEEIKSGTLVFVPLIDEKIPLSLLSLVTASGRVLSGSASRLLQHIVRRCRSPAHPMSDESLETRSGTLCSLPEIGLQARQNHVGGR